MIIKANRDGPSNGRQMQASVDVNKRRGGKANLANSLPQNKLAAKQKKELTQSVVQASKDKSKIMVELMPFHGNSGRASTKVATGRNGAEDFNSNIERIINQEESLRVNRGKEAENNEVSYQSNATVHGQTLDVRVSRGLRSNKGQAELELMSLQEQFLQKTDTEPQSR